MGGGVAYYFEDDVGPAGGRGFFIDKIRVGLGFCLVEGDGPVFFGEFYVFNLYL